MLFFIYYLQKFITYALKDNNGSEVRNVGEQRNKKIYLFGFMVTLININFSYP